jgi:hypothetical protein
LNLFGIRFTQHEFITKFFQRHFYLIPDLFFGSL